MVGMAIAVSYYKCGYGLMHAAYDLCDSSSLLNLFDGVPSKFFRWGDK